MEGKRRRNYFLAQENFFLKKRGNKKKLVARSIHTVEIGVGIAVLIIFHHGARCFVHLAASVPTGGGIYLACLPGKQIKIAF